MPNLTDVYNQIASKDVELEKEAAELYKQAEEEDAAGRIMARGFADELAKLAEPYNPAETFAGKKPGGLKPQPTVPSGGYQTGGGNTGQNYDPLGGKKRGGNAAAMAGGGSKGPVVGAPPAKPAVKPPQPTLAAGGPKPPKMQ